MKATGPWNQHNTRRAPCKVPKVRYQMVIGPDPEAAGLRAVSPARTSDLQTAALPGVARSLPTSSALAGYRSSDGSASTRRRGLVSLKPRMTIGALLLVVDVRADP
jgi:hypothetical protein